MTRSRNIHTNWFSAIAWPRSYWCWPSVTKPNPLGPRPVVGWRLSTGKPQAHSEKGTPRNLCSSFVPPVMPSTSTSIQVSSQVASCKLSSASVSPEQGADTVKRWRIPVLLARSVLAVSSALVHRRGRLWPLPGLEHQILVSLLA